MQKYNSEKATKKGARTQKRKKYSGCQMMPTGGGGTGRNGAIAVPADTELAMDLLLCCERQVVGTCRSRETATCSNGI